MSNLSRGAPGVTSATPYQGSPRRRANRAARLCRLAREIASAAFDVSVAEIARPNRSAATICEARHAAMYVAHVSFQVPLTSIAREFGRDRTSVGHAIRRIEDRRDETGFDRRLERVEVLAESCLALAIAAEGR